MTPEEKREFCERVEAGAHAVEAARSMLVPWETVKRALAMDAFFANRWRIAMARNPRKQGEPALVLELERPNGRLLREVQALMLQEDVDRGSSHDCDECGASLRFDRGDDCADPDG